MPPSPIASTAFLLPRPYNLRPSSLGSFPYRCSPRRFCTASMQPSAPISNSNSIADALHNVLGRIAETSAACGREPAQLVAVSKTKPLELLQAAYDAGQRHFGENYVQELVSKGPQLPSDIKWHFIGALQSNKAKTLVALENLHVVESVDREKTATALNKAVVALGREPLKVMVQVNTSGEESKSGCEPGETVHLAQYVERKCDGLELIGLMTIGAPDDAEEPVAFRVLKGELEAVEKDLGRERGSLMLSMGMSGDYERAIRMGSDSVRVGSTIFGAREYPNRSK